MAMEPNEDPLGQMELLMMWGGLEGMGWGWIGLGLVHMVLFWAVVILALVALVKWLAPGAPPFSE